MEPLLLNQKVLVTGGSRGIGRACALALARQGADVAVHYHRRRDHAEAVAKEVAAMGREALVVAGAMENAMDIDHMFSTIEAQWGHLDCYVANAAATAFKPLEQLSAYHLDRTHHVVTGSFLQSAQRCLPLMRGRGGRIIAISSIGSRYALPRYTALGTAKAAMEAMVRYVAAEFGRYGITCNAISPGVVDTDSSHFYAGEEYQAWHDMVVRQTPLGRLAKPEDVADLVVLLLSQGARFLTGQVIHLDGGASLSAPGFEQV